METTELKSEKSKRQGVRRDAESTGKTEKESRGIKISDGEDVGRDSQKQLLASGGMDGTPTSHSLA